MRINSPLAIKRRKLNKERTQIRRLRHKAHQLFDLVFPLKIEGYKWLRDNFTSDHFSLMTEIELERIIKILEYDDYLHPPK